MLTSVSWTIGADGALRGALDAVETRNRDQFTQKRDERVEVECV